MEKKEKIKSEEIDLIGLVKKVWDGRWMLVAFVVVGLVLGGVIILSIPRVYRSEAKIVPEDTKELKMNSTGTLASLMGLSVDNMSNAEISPDLYPEIIESTPYLIDFANMRVQPQNKPELSLYEYIMNYQRDAWWEYVLGLPRTISGLFSKKEIWHNDTVWNSFKLTVQQRQFINTLSDNIYVKADRQTGLISISVAMQDPVVAAVVSERVVQKLYSYIEDFRTQKIQEEIRFIEEMFVESRKTYNQTQLRFNEFSKSNKHDDTPLTTQVDVDLAFGLYNMMAQQYEMVKVKVLKKQPIFSIIEPATIPLNAATPRKTLILLICLGLGLFCGVIWTFVKDAF